MVMPDNLKHVVSKVVAMPWGTIGPLTSVDFNIQIKPYSVLHMEVCNVIIPGIFLGFQAESGTFYRLEHYCNFCKLSSTKNPR